MSATVSSLILDLLDCSLSLTDLNSLNFIDRALQLMQNPADLLSH